MSQYEGLLRTIGKMRVGSIGGQSNVATLPNSITLLQPHSTIPVPTDEPLPSSPTSGTYSAEVSGVSFFDDGAGGVVLQPGSEIGATDEIFLDPSAMTFVHLPGGITLTSVSFDMAWAGGTVYPSTMQAEIRVYSSGFTVVAKFVQGVGNDSDASGETLHVEGTEDYAAIGDGFPYTVPPEGAFIGPGYFCGSGTPSGAWTAGTIFTFDWEI